MKITVSTKGRIVLPAEIRKRDDIRTGQQFEIERIQRGEYHIKRKQSSPNEGLMEWLQSCPDKDFFVPMESESTDTL